jgi:hypothetical protein
MNLLHQSTHIQSISQVLAKEVFVDNNSRNIDCPTGRDFRRRADRAKNTCFITRLSQINGLDK